MDGRIVPGKPRTKPTTNRWRRWWREGGRPEGRRAATHAPDSVPDVACNRSRKPADRGCMGRQSPEPRSRSTFGRSPVRESRTPGSARGGRGNPVPYRCRISRAEMAPEDQQAITCQGEKRKQARPVRGWCGSLSERRPYRRQKLAVPLHAQRHRAGNGTRGRCTPLA